MVDLLGDDAVCWIAVCTDMFQCILAYFYVYSVIEPANANVFAQLASEKALVSLDELYETFVPSQQHSQNCCIAVTEG